MADRLIQLGWILLGLAVACVFTMFFAAAGVAAAVLGAALLIGGRLARLAERRAARRVGPATQVIDVRATLEDEPRR